MAEDRWHIEGEFRDGRARTRDSNGRYQSVSTAILKEVSEFETFTASDLAPRIGVDENIVLEHLGHLENEGLVSESNGGWSKESEAPESLIPTEDNHLFPWEGRNADDESLY
jgi:predicted Rossmann fold nucleotide-binding protein DprA/Smf involved in DNA uptake